MVDVAEATDAVRSAFNLLQEYAKMTRRAFSEVAAEYAIARAPRAVLLIEKL